MATFYCTYGTDPKYPYYGGWTEIDADDMNRAVIAFRKFHPNREGSELTNCAFMYSEETWASTKMAKNHENFGHACREHIMVTEEHVPVYNGEVLTAVIESVNYSRLIIDDE